MLGSAAGRAYLAFCGGPERDALLELLSRSSLPEDRMARSRIEVERLLNETRTQGFGMAQRARRVSEETSLAIPVRAKQRILAAVTVRYAASAVPLRTAIEQFLPRMRDIAQKIEAEFAQTPGITLSGPPARESALASGAGVRAGVEVIRS
jgi:IclR family mhp operon transcriptional activator